MSLKSQFGKYVRRKLAKHFEGRLLSIRYRGFKFYIDLGDGVISWRLLLGIGYEEKSKDLAMSLVRLGDCVIDVGANIGDYTLPFSAVVGPKGRVIAFEPAHRSFIVLQKNIGRNGARNVEAYEAAVGDADGTCTLCYDATNFGGNSLSASAMVAVGTGFKVPLKRLDTFCESARIVPDLIKADVQGAESLMLTGATRLLENDRTAFWIEFWPAGLVAFGCTVAQLLELLGSHQRKLYLIDEGKLVPILIDQIGNMPLQHGYADILSAPQGWLEARMMVEKI